MENHRLIQEIETLRHQLAQLRERDQERLVVTPGVSWPIVIEMHPPGVQMETADDSLTARLGDALTDQTPPSSEVPEEAHAPAGGAITVAATETFATGTPDAATSPEVAATSFSASTTEAARKTPAATPIYDPARDLGTLALHNFDQLRSFAPTTNATGTALREGTGAFGNAANANFSATAGNTVEAAANVEMASPVYSLWVLPSSTSEPVLVGQLPDDLPVNATVDFTLGTTGIIPKAYYILGSAAQQPLVYDTRSILLQGP